MSLIFDGTFQSGSRADRNHWIGTGWGTLYNACLVDNNALQVVNSPAGMSGNVGRFTIKPGDACNSSIGDERAMIDTGRYEPGTEEWMSFSVYIPDTFKPAGKTWNMVNQTKDTNDLYVNTAIYLSTDNGAPYWNIRAGYPAQYFNFPGVPVYGWSTWLVHMKWSFANDGLIEYYRNGVLVKSVSGIRTLKDNTKVYSHIGLYRNPGTTTLSAYFTGLKMGTSRADVDNGNVPLPPPGDNNPPDVVEMGGLGQAVSILAGAYVLKFILEKVKK